MTWIKLDDDSPDHPKIDGLSDRTFRWWIRGLCFASKYLTDGLLPFVFLRRVPRSVQSELRKAKLWITRKNGEVEIHDYLEHQRSKDQVLRERARNLRRKPGGGTGGTTRGTAGGGTEEVPRPEYRVQIHPLPLPREGVVGRRSSGCRASRS